MNFKQLGKTCIQVPEIGLGTWKYRQDETALRAAIDAGVSLIDTAESYGTEDLIGRAVHGIRNRILIATKVSSKNFRRTDLLKSADASLRRLRTDYIDLYQLHYPARGRLLEEAMFTMEQLARTGKIRFIGVCNFSRSDLARAQTALSTRSIVSNQVPYNLLDRHIEFDTLPFCQRNNITVIAYSPFASNFALIKARDRTAALRHLADVHGCTEAQAALNWCICKPSVIAIPKSSSTGHAIENCKASGWYISSDEIQFLEKAIKHPGRVGDALRRSAWRAFRQLRLRGA